MKSFLVNIFVINNYNRNNKTKINLALFIVFLLISFPKIIFTQQTIAIATGTQGNNYYLLGQSIAYILEKEYHDIFEVIVLATEGSIQNAKLIENNSAQLALIQSDVAYYFYKGERIFAFPSDSMKGVASLYTEAIHIITKKEDSVGNIFDLIEKKISIGEKGSGTEFHSKLILSAYNISDEDLFIENMHLSEGINMLKSDILQAVFITTGFPNNNINNLDDQYSLLSLDKNVMAKLKKNYPFFINCTIDNKTYPFLKKPVNTLGVRCLLVANKNIMNDVIEKIVVALLKNRGELGKMVEVAKQIKKKNILLGMKIPLHPGAKRYYEKEGILESYNKIYDAIIITVLICITIFLIFIFNYHTKIGRYFKTNLYLRLFILFVSIYIISTTFLYFFERNYNSCFKTIGESFWSTVIFVLSGMDIASPITPMGRIFTALVLCSNMAIFGLIVGKITELIINRKGVRMSKNTKKHIIICNWNEKGEEIVKEIHSPDGAPDIDIMVLSKPRPNNEEEIRRNFYKEFRNVEFREADPTIFENLERANVKEASSVIVLSNPDCTDPDSLSLITVVIVKKLIGSNNSPRIIVETSNPQRKKHFLAAGANEVICNSAFSIGLIAQSALVENIVPIFEELLTYNNLNEIYVLDDSTLTKKLKGKSFSEVGTYFFQNRNNNNPLILLGISRKGEIKLNPKEDLIIEEDDKLIVMAYEKKIKNL